MSFWSRLIGRDGVPHFSFAELEERASRQRAEALASKLADALERERERYHALAQSLVSKAAPPPPTLEQGVTDATQGIVPIIIVNAIQRVAGGDQRLASHLRGWASLPEQRERMQTPTGLAGVVEEIVRGKQRSA